MMKIYTRGGDAGHTSLFGGSRVAKNDPLIEAYGTVDELNSVIGVVRAVWPSGPLDPPLALIQADLFDLGAFLASPEAPALNVPSSRIDELERDIDAMESELAPLRNFILPGGSLPAAHLHVARTVCRRAERLVVALGERYAEVIRYLNRLSDYLFVAARFANLKLGRDDELWKR
jgi:cob(I)alamin adenosyltransferase